jgi:hypothetical protein
MARKSGLVRNFVRRTSARMGARSTGRPAALSALPRPLQSPPFRKKILFESLEPRLLLSADLAPDVASTLSSGVDQFRDWAATLAAHEQFAQQLPVVNTSLGDAVDLSGWLQTRFVDPVQAYLGGSGPKTTDGLVAALAERQGVSAVTGDQYGNVVRFDLVLDASRTLEDVSLSIPATADGMPVTSEAGVFDLTGSLQLNFSFGVDLTPGLSVDDAFFVKFNTFAVKGDIQANAIDFDVSVGFLGATVNQGSINLNADLRVQVGNPDGDAAGHVTLAELYGTDLGNLVSFDTSLASVAAQLPIRVAGLGSFNPGSVQIVLGGDPFTDVTVSITGNDAAEVANFGRLTPFAVTSALQRVAIWLDDIGTSSSMLAQDVPFASDLKYKDILDFSTALTETVNRELAIDGVPVFDNAQEFSSLLASLLGVPPAAVAANYNATTNQLTFFLRLDETFETVATPVSFGFDLGPLGDLTSDSMLTVGADGRLQFTLGFDLSPFESVISGLKDLPANGVLSADATFLVSVNAAEPVAVTVQRNAANTSRAQLIANVNAALANAGLGEVTASLVANRLQFKVAGDLYGASLTIYVTDPATNTAGTQLGLNEIMANSATQVNRAFVRDLQLTGNARIAANDIDASGNFGFVGVDIVDGTLSADATVQVQVRDPAAPSAPIRVGQFFTALNEIDNWAQINTQGALTATLPVQVQGGVLGLGLLPRADVSMANVFDPATLNVAFQGMEALTNYQNVDLQDVLAALNQFVSYLASVEQFSFLGIDLPVIDRSVAELLSFIPGLEQDIAKLSDLGAANLQELETRIEEAFGVGPNALVMTFADNDLRFALNLTESLPAAYQNLKVNLDLAQLAGYVPGGVANLAGVGNLIDVAGDGSLAVTGSAQLNLVFGFDLTNPTLPRAYLEDDTGMSLLLRVAGNNLNFDAAVGPLGLFIRNGTVLIGNAAGPAAFTVGLKPVAGGRYYDSQWNTSILDVGLVGQASAVLPVFFPQVTNYAGDIVLTVGSLADLAGTTSLSAPDLAAEIGSIDLFSNLGSLVQGLDLLLAGLEDALDGEVFGVELPIVGDNLKDAANFFGDLRSS